MFRSFFYDYRAPFIALLVIIIILFVLWFIKFVSLPVPYGKLISEIPEVGSKEFRIKHKNMFRYLIHKDKVYVGKDRSNDIIIPFLEPKHVILKAEVRRVRPGGSFNRIKKPVLTRRKKVIRVIKNGGNYRIIKKPNSLFPGNNDILCSGEEIEFILKDGKIFRFLYRL